MSAHRPDRPSWICLECDNPWPCVHARRALREEHVGHSAALAMYMAGQVVAAAPELDDKITAGDLYRRFLGWLGPPS